MFYYNKIIETINTINSINGESPAQWDTIINKISEICSAIGISIYLINSKNRISYFQGINAGNINIKNDVIFKIFIKKEIEFPAFSEIFESFDLESSVLRNKKKIKLLIVPLYVKEKNIGLLILYKKIEFIKEEFLSLKILGEYLSCFFHSNPLFQVNDDNGLDESYCDEMIFKSKSMRSISEIAKRVAVTNSTVLLTGESGVGKEVLAKYIHINSLRNEKRFVAVSCGAIAQGLIESELFGSKKGAFTGSIADKKGKFMIADKGTLFLDEISEISNDIQVKLLRAIQEKTISPLGDERDYPVDVRIIAATNKNLESLIKANLFREDLYFRLNVVDIAIPPLRERKEDIPDLVNYFKDKYNTMFNKKIDFTEAAILKISNNGWRGNIRELENFIERTILLSDSNIINDLDFKLSVKPFEQIVKDISEENLTLNEADKIFKKEFIKSKLKENNWKISLTAEKLKIQRTYLSRLIKEFSLKSNKKLKY
ncbi:MAG TPA: sigma-54 dependent transcriptional regulator [bacterium]|nr:sigma-54 dependent transcriptional regulator [bacterium]HPN29445.1 sigma-54 dependent transcriptional regulator [bacterium]